MIGDCGKSRDRLFVGTAIAISIFWKSKFSSNWRLIMEAIKYLNEKEVAEVTGIAVQTAKRR